MGYQELKRAGRNTRETHTETGQGQAWSARGDQAESRWMLLHGNKEESAKARLWSRVGVRLIADAEQL